MTMRLTLDRESDAVYVYVTDRSERNTTRFVTVDRGVVRTRALDENRLLDLDDTGEVLGIELLNVSHGVVLAGLPFSDELAALLREHGIGELT